MKSKNTIVLSIIGLATLIISIFGATFAYFSARNVDEKGTANVNITTGNVGTSQFMAFFDESEVSFNIALVDMLDKNHGGVDGSNNKNASINLDVSLSSVDDQTNTTCSFDIVYTWSGDGNDYGTEDNSQLFYYKKSSSLDTEEEFVYTLNHGDIKGTPVEFATAQVPDNPIENPQKVVLNGDTKLSISDSLGDILNPTKDSYTIGMEFNNFNLLKQDEQKSRTFNGILSVENISCEYSPVS